MSWIEEQLLRERLVEAQRRERSVRTARLLRARRRAEVAARRADRLSARADELAAPAPLIGAGV
ncbi:hypothetical protein ACFFKU_04995 [Kineococcus gynurae]|uniref:Uncharacterized protein n=1 Tax=Kineococcus gynurae TaxID=452979 RepID=A0ABV5LNA2_9ACTN